MEKLYAIEFNPGAKTNIGLIRIETLETRLKKNFADLLDKGDLQDKNWILIGVAENMKKAGFIANTFLRQYYKKYPEKWDQIKK